MLVSGRVFGEEVEFQFRLKDACHLWGGFPPQISSNENLGVNGSKENWQPKKIKGDMDLGIFCILKFITGFQTTTIDFNGC